jgi:hypothetical protein
MPADPHLTHRQALARLLPYVSVDIADEILSRLPAVRMPVGGHPLAWSAEVIDEACVELERMAVEAREEADPTVTT